MSSLPADALRTCESDLSVLETVDTAQPGPAGALPLEPADLLERPSGDLFGWTLNAGMGWQPDAMRRPEVLILSTQGGIRENDGSPLALGYHTGHWEVGLLMRAAAEELRTALCMPFAGYVTDPCDGRTQGTTGMMDSLPYRNDAAMVLGRLIRSLPTRVGVIGVATCDKGLPAMMMAVAGAHGLPGVIVPGGVTLPATDGEDAGKVQTLGARFAHGSISLEEAAEMGCRACASPGGGCQFLGTAATSQVVAEALGLSVVHSALAPSGQPVWLDMARRSARGVLALRARKKTVRDVVTDAADPQRDGRARRLRRLDQPAAAHSRRRARRGPGPSDHRRVARREPPRAAPRRLAAERPAPDGARVPRRRRAGSDAAPARARPARSVGAHRLGRAARRHAGVVGGVAAPAARPRAAARARRHRSRRRDHAAAAWRGPGG